MPTLDRHEYLEARIDHIFAGPGEMRERCRAFDWAATPLGSADSWPASLRTAVGIVMASPLPMWIGWGPDFRQIYNDAYLGLSERHPGSLGRPLAETWADIWHLIGDEVDAVYAGGTAVLHEDRLIPYRRDGNFREGYFHYSYSAIPDDTAANGVGGVLAVALETTTRIIPDQVGRKRRERNEALLSEISRELIRLTDIGDTMARLGERIGRFFGVKWCMFGEVVGRDEMSVASYGWNEAGKADLRGTYRMRDYLTEAQIASHLRGEPSIVYDVRTDARYNGARYEALGTLSFVLIPLVRDGGWRFRLSIVDDAPRQWTDAEIALLRELAERIWLRLERARAEEALRVSEKRFRTVTDLVPDLIWQSEPDGATPWYNARWFEYTGQTLEESRGWGWVAAIHPDDRPRARANYARSTEHGEPLMQELRIRRRDGVYRWFLARAEPLRDEAGRVVRWFGTATDVHVQRMAYEEVERLIDERTAERDALRRQLAEAEEAERRRLARELHDRIGQQLTAIALGAEDAMRLAAAHDGAHAAPDAPLLRRLDGLQELARAMQLNTRHLALELRPPELDDVGLESALTTYVREWSSRYDIAAEIAAIGLAEHTLPTVIGSALYRIAQEALTNVAKHAAASQVSVIVERRDAWVRLVVEDDGRGFDVEMVARRAKHERRFELAGIRERAMLVGGSVMLESSPGFGTSLFVLLPAGEPTTPPSISAI